MARFHWRTKRCLFLAVSAHFHSSQGHPVARANLRTSRCPFLAKLAHVSLYQGHPRDRAYWRTSRCPFSAARAHVFLFKGNRWARAHWSVARCPHSKESAIVIPEFLPQGPFDSPHYNLGHARRARRRVRPARPRDLPQRQGLLARRRRDPRPGRRLAPAD